jgi:hypothetical protein
MNMKNTDRSSRALLVVAAHALLLLSAPAFAADPAAKKSTAHAHHADRSPVASPVVLVHKSPSCTCCAAWVDHLRAAGFTVEVDANVAMGEVKERVGIPPGKGSCHTAEVGGYFVEGHVPVADIQRLLAEKPDARGLTAPGMPPGSPGMEVPDGSTPKYAVELVHRDGSTEVFAEHGGSAAKGKDEHAQHDHEH